MKAAVLLTSSLLLLPSLVRAAGVQTAQTITLQPGWNAVYIEVTPDETADEIFRDWPVEWVARYDPASFLETKQYSGMSSTEGTRSSGYVVWRRAEGPLSPLTAVTANCAYMCFSTNSAGVKFYKTIYGRPAAPRVTWHPSSTNEPMNFVGFSTQPGAKPTIGDYFDGLDTGSTSYYRFYGNDPAAPALRSVSGATEFTNGAVVVANAAKASDWSGALYVSPMDGVDFSTNLTKSVVTIRNDSTKARKVSVTLGSGAALSPAMPPTVPIGLKWRDGSNATNAWCDFSPSAAIDRDIAVGETFSLELALDRTQYGASTGAYYGALLHVDDRGEAGGTSEEAGSSGLRVTVPVEATSDGGAGGANAWPKGLWLVSGVFNQVNYINDSSSENARAGGMVRVRMPMYVDNSGNMTLLQRVTYGTDTNGAVHVYSANVAGSYPVPIANARRISSAVLPIDEPCIAAATNATFGGIGATFPFIVGEHARSNPLRHAFHPMHDGLNANFDGLAPSGDNLQNYVTSTTKPELFSITNRIVFTWDETQGTAWSPEEMCSGTLTWELDGVRREGTVKMEGAFTMKRISSATLDK